MQPFSTSVLYFDLYTPVICQVSTSRLVMSFVTSDVQFVNYANI